MALPRFTIPSRTRFKSLIAAVLCCSAASAQIQADSVRHLFDFSSEKATIYVDPILDLSYGVSLAGSSEVWRNVRGASFSADWDSHWTAWGSLEEHQSIRVLEESWWTAQNGSLPGWGRAKLGRNLTLNSPDTLYVDVARAMGALSWHENPTTQLGWSVRLGMLPFGWGISDRASTLGLKSTSAPAPELRVAHASENRVLWAGFSKWVLDTRAPLGATSESLFEWTHSAMVGADFFLSERLLLRQVIGATWTAHPERADGRWASRSGWTGAGLKWSGQRLNCGVEAAHELLDWRSEGGGWNAGAWRWLAEAQVGLGPLRLGGTVFVRERPSAEWAADPEAFSLLTHAGLPLGQIWSDFVEFSAGFTSDSKRLSIYFYQQYTDWGRLTKTELYCHVWNDRPVFALAGMRWSPTADLTIFELGISVKAL